MTDRTHATWRRSTRAAALVALAALALTMAGCNTTSGDERGPATPLTASGVVQARTVAVAGEFGGRIVALPVTEGARVRRGDPLARLDTAELDAQIEVLRATVAMAEAGLAQARAGARPDQIAVAEAQLAQARAGHDAARQAVSDTLALLADPQDLELQIAVTEAQLASAEHRLAQAVANKNAVEVGKAELDDAYAQWDGGGRHRVAVREGTLDDPLDLPPELEEWLPDPGELPDGTYTWDDWELHVHDGGYTLYRWVNVAFPLEAMLLPNTWWQAWVGVNAAGAEKDGLQAALATLYAQRAQPLALQTRADQAQGALAQAEARVAMAEAQVEGLRAGATAAQIATLEARADQARAGLRALLRQREMYTLTAPIAGTVVDVVLHPGEVAAPGAKLLSLADLHDLTLTVYVPETRLGQVWVGQTVRITVNSFSDRAFDGEVTRVADRAEFTPRNVSTQEERVNLVFAVEIRVTDTSGALKPGMPADVQFEE